ncbi:hypothetical protein ACXYMO_06860 [Arenibacterium sp. CAU 1754]
MLDNRSFREPATESPAPNTEKGTRAALFHLWRGESQDPQLSEHQMPTAADDGEMQMTAPLGSEPYSTTTSEDVFQSDSFEFWD